MIIDTDHSTQAKARKALLTSAVITLAISNLEFATDRLSIFGLELVVSQTRLQHFGQLVTLYLLVVFLLRSLPGLVRAFHNNRLASIKREEQAAWNKWKADYDWDTPAALYGDPPDVEREAIEQTFAFKTSLAEKRHELSVSTTKISVSLVVEFFAPLAIAFLTLCTPQYVNTAATSLFADSPPQTLTDGPLEN